MRVLNCFLSIALSALTIFGALGLIFGFDNHLTQSIPLAYIAFLLLEYLVTKELPSPFCKASFSFGSDKSHSVHHTDKADNVSGAVALYAEQHEEPDNIESVLTDMMTDMLHLATRENLDADRLPEIARIHFNTEV